jgi:hypothetical protein
MTEEDKNEKNENSFNDSPKFFVMPDLIRHPEKSTS